MINPHLYSKKKYILHLTSFLADSRISMEGTYGLTMLLRGQVASGPVAAVVLVVGAMAAAAVLVVGAMAVVAALGARGGG